MFCCVFNSKTSGLFESDRVVFTVAGAAAVWMIYSVQQQHITVAAVWVRAAGAVMEDVMVQWVVAATRGQQCDDNNNNNNMLTFCVAE